MVDNYYKNSWKHNADDLTKKKLLEPNQQESLHHMIDSPDQENFVLAEELLRLKITDAMVAGLNKGQSYAFTQIVDYLRDPQLYCGAVLKGYAGTGKTYLVKRIIEFITKTHPRARIAITAPTNKAVSVLSKNSPFGNNGSIFEDYGTPEDKIVYCTIHKLLGMKEVVSDTGEQNFVIGEKNADITDYFCLIVDEVSMLDDYILHLLMKFKDKLRFIFLGDPCQIPPIKRLQTLVFMDKCPYQMVKLELTQIMRQIGDNPIIDIGMLIRTNLTHPDPTVNIKTKLINKKGIIYINGEIERHKVKEIMHRFFTDPIYLTNVDFVKIIAYRNKTVNYLNGVVRKMLYGDTVQEYTVGDKLVANKALFDRTPTRNRWSGPNDYTYTVKRNTSEELDVTGVDIVTRSFKESVKNTPLVQFTGIFWKLNVKTKNGNDVLYILHKDSEAEFKLLAKELKVKAQEMKRADYWVMQKNMLKWTDDVIYNYAITAHKSQGSSYQHVILIEEDLNTNHKIVERNRIKYTAYTRATDRVYVLK